RVVKGDLRCGTDGGYRRWRRRVSSWLAGEKEKLEGWIRCGFLMMI
ncbi:hypothetical protein LINGRAHAP2_LOCUS13585, partial [Linum grandiflorum]